MNTTVHGFGLSSFLVKTSLASLITFCLVVVNSRDLQCIMFSGDIFAHSSLSSAAIHCFPPQGKVYYIRRGFTYTIHHVPNMPHVTFVKKKDQLAPASSKKEEKKDFFAPLATINRS